MQTNHRTIQRFFHSFAEGDYRGMQDCLHPDIEFTDLGFDLRGRQVGAMWHMICAKGTRIMFRDIQTDGPLGTTHWECHYYFAKAEGDDPRPVHNVIEARFRFEGGLIREHRDDCDFERWAQQALGLPGLPPGHAAPLQAKIRESATAKLAQFTAAHPEYA